MNVATQVKSPARTYLETFRRQYYETLIPSYRLVREGYVQRGTRHSAFSSSPLDYEVDRFLSWTKLTFTTDETLRSNPLRTGPDLEGNIAAHIEKWLAADAKPDLDRVDRLAKLKDVFRDGETLKSASFDELAEVLRGCAAFTEQLRFTKGGEPVLLNLFKKDNDLDRLQRNFNHLAFGSGEFVQRTYDCIFSPELRLRHFGRNCILELFGWINHENVPPLNGRSIGALRYLGFDVL